MTDSARDYLLSIPLEDQKELGLMWSPRYRKSRGDDILESYEMPFFTVSQATSHSWKIGRDAIRHTYDGLPVWITESVETHLGGLTLDLIMVDVSDSQQRPFLVAA